MPTATPPKITLYGAKGTCSLAAHILLNETGADFELLQLAWGPFGLEGGDSKLSRDEFLSFAPKGVVPVLRVASSPNSAQAPSSDETVTETPAILTYIATATAPAARAEALLGGASPFARAKCLEWMVWLSASLHGHGFASMWRPARFVGEHEEVYGALQAHGRKVVDAAFETIEAAIGDKWAMGDEWTAVDAQLYVFWRWAMLVFEYPMDAKYPRYSAVMRRVQERESVKRTLEIEGLEPCA